MMRFITASCIAINAAAAVVSAEPERSPQVTPPTSRFFRMPFHERTPIDADQVEEVRSCANKEVDDDFDQAEGAIFHAIEDAEKALLHAVEDEVDTLFHEFPPKQQKHNDMDAAGKRKGKAGSSTEVQEASYKVGWRNDFPEDLQEALEDCLDGMME